MNRIGQARPVLMLRLCTSDSVEIELLQEIIFRMRMKSSSPTRTSPSNAILTLPDVPRE
jgi:hypothetical protein